MHRYGPAVLRVVLGIIFMAHGAQKLFGAWGGPGISGTAGFFGQVGLTPAYPLAVLVTVVEFAGGILLMLGALTMVAALALAIEMGVAIWKVHFVNGFFLMGPSGRLGYEYNVLLIAALVCLVLTGPGVFSVDGRRARDAEAQAAGRARLRAGKV